MKKSYLIKIEYCQRCGGNHEIEFVKLDKPIIIENEVFNYWASCPITKEPILNKITKE